MVKSFRSSSTDAWGHTQVICKYCRHKMIKCHIQRHLTGNQCLLWSVGGRMPNTIRMMRDSTNYRRQLSRGLRVFKNYLMDNLDIQRDENRRRALRGAFVHFCPKPGMMGIGGDVKSFSKLVQNSIRDLRLDFFVLGQYTFSSKRVRRAALDSELVRNGTPQVAQSRGANCSPWASVARRRSISKSGAT